MISEEVRKAVFERDGYACQLWHRTPYQEHLEIFHVVHQGMGGRPSVHELNQPKNLLTVCHRCHMRFHGFGAAYRVLYFNPDDPDNGLVILRRNKPVPKEELYFYLSRWRARNTGRLEELKKLAFSRTAAFWLLAKELYEAKKKKEYLWLGDYDSIYELGFELGLTTSEVRFLIRAWTLAQTLIDVGAVDEEELLRLDPRVMRLLSARPHMAEAILSHALTLHPADFWEWAAKALRREAKARRGFIVRSPVREIMLDPDMNLAVGPDEVVIQGGRVLVGGTKVEIGELDDEELDAEDT